MHAFFFRNHRAFLAVILFVVAVSMLFYGASGKDIAQGVLRDEVVYRVGEKGHQKVVTKRQIEAMKTYLSYDMGYFFNDSLDRQNIFADGFFLELISSSFGKKLLQKTFSLVEGDFGKRVKLHRKHRMYRHPSGKFKLEDVMQRYARNLYEGYKKVQDPQREVSVSLMIDLIELAALQKDFKPSDMQKLALLSVRDKKLGHDPVIDQMNFALFHTKSNAEMFGAAFMELMAQAVLEGARFAGDHGYSTLYEEAEGVIMRRALSNLTKKYPMIEKKEELERLKDRYEAGLGISRKDLVEAAMSVITFQKMMKDVDNTVILDSMACEKLFSDKVDTLLVAKVQDSPNMSIAGVQDALELQCYLECIGKCQGFLQVPKSCYEREAILERASDLITSEYVLKLAGCTREQMLSSMSQKSVWGFQTSDKGWGLLCEKFSFDKGMEKKGRFTYLQALDAKIGEGVDLFTREKMVEERPDLAAKTLAKAELKRAEISLHAKVSSNQFGEGFDEKALLSKIEGLEEGEELCCYTQDNQMYFRVMVVKKPGKEIGFPSFRQAKDKGYLRLLLDEKLTALNKGKEFSDSGREALMHRLIKKEAGPVIAKEIIDAEKEKLFYLNHQKKRLEAWKGEEEPAALDELLKQFSVVVSSEVIGREGENKHLAQEEFFTLTKGDISSYHTIGRGSVYYVQLVAKQVDKNKLQTLCKKLYRELADEARGAMYSSIVSHIEENKMIEYSRFKEGA